MFPFLALLSLLNIAQAVPQATSSPHECIGSISSLGDVDAAVQCTTVNIYSFTVPAGKTFNLDLVQGTTVNILGAIQFGNVSWSGPLFKVKGQYITFNGNGHIWDGGGSFYWDGHGSNSGMTKPSPMMKIEISGTLSDVHVVNSPVQCFSVNNPGPIVISDVIIDNSQGDRPNANSNGSPAGHNTDGFDVSGNDVVIKHSTVINQDDCLALNRGQNILFEDNYCSGGHGISLGSVSSDVVVDGVVIRGNTVVNSRQAFRIKTDKSAKNSIVTNVTYSDNTASNCTDYGVLITQSYPETLGEPGNGVSISYISFSGGMTDISVMGNAETVAVNCGKDSCTGIWDWSSLATSGGKAGKTKNIPNIDGYDV